jgi:hypothetical protein
MTIGGRADWHGCVRAHVRVTYDAEAPDIKKAETGPVFDKMFDKIFYQTPDRFLPFGLHLAIRLELIQALSRPETGSLKPWRDMRAGTRK